MEKEALHLRPFLSRCFYGYLHITCCLHFSLEENKKEKANDEVASSRRSIDYKKVSVAWRNWIEGKAANLIDPNLSAGSNRDMMRCIHIGLLCVQENVANRPTMALVVHMLTGGTLSLPTPSKPAFFMHSSTTTDNLESSALDQSNNFQLSLNTASITELSPR
ncbi:cysteine-rich receptor-like protein kinase 29 [Pistacia vera]|uniref:cysteine-rich receptor-like protein kinase 29 n=1 Tax=Pistacia vera TaxID=55513 RepID=UPI0012633DDD|nr:cysteine-rich receptor-like protein kinase 29 [Pistacia vera]